VKRRRATDPTRRVRYVNLFSGLLFAIRRDLLASSCSGLRGEEEEEEEEEEEKMSLQRLGERWPPLFGAQRPRH